MNSKQLRQRHRFLVVILAALCIAGCEDPGVAAGTGTSTAAKAGSPPASAAAASRAAFPADSIEVDAHLNGQWSPVQNWPLIPIHAITLPDGRVMTYGTKSVAMDPGAQATGKFVFDVWTPSLGFGASAHATLPNGPGTDLFCSSQIVLPGSGGVLISGGDTWNGFGTTNTGNNNSNVFNPANNTLTRGPDMNRGRWYASTTMLTNGEVYVQGGTSGEDFPEVRQLDGSFRLLSNVNTRELRYNYPRNYVVLDGRVFGYTTDGRMYYVNPAGTGSIDRGPPENRYHFPNFVFLGDDSTSAMFRPGRILEFGGNSSGAIVVDVTAGGRPKARSTRSPSSQRRLATATLLPTGEVLATGGSTRYNELVGVNNSAEIWNPERDAWRRGSEGTLARLYHSSAVLLPDATVLVGGGGQGGPLNNTNVEVYYPPYLFTEGRQLARRPVVTASPESLTVGQSFALSYDQASSISRVTLVKFGAQTHGFNQDQRFVELPFTVTASGTGGQGLGGQLTVNMTSRPSDVPPGHYMMFLISAEGTPSVSRPVWIGVAPPADGHQPSLPNPGDRQSIENQPVSLQLAASDPDGDPLVYAAAGLPPGLAVNPQTGLISGTPTQPGEFNVVLSVRDSFSHSTTANLTWIISGDAPLTLDPIPPRAPVQAGTEVLYTAHAPGSNVRYRWNYGDGTSETQYSPSANTSRYYQPGVYFVTVTAIDDRGIETRETFMQIIHGALTPTRATQSTSVLHEPVGGGAGRVWVVNPDNHSVSVLDAASGERLDEISVGAAPRSIARAADGNLWVSNSQGGSVSVIDPATLQVRRTLTLPTGSQPWGIAMSPDGAYAYIALQGSGQVLKYRTRSLLLLASGDTGPNPRHLSVSADGRTVFVSRFITPHQPGESTASVQVAADGRVTGGEVLRLRASNLTALGTIVLRHSTKPDFENQGSGVPNYLGALAISPDGTQGYVPSKQDNIRRGELRNRRQLNFQNTVRAISSRIDLSNNREDPAARVDHDNASVASAAVFDSLGVFLFVALETSREVAVLSAHDHFQLLRFDVGMAPQGLTISADGNTLYVDNFMDRSVGVFDLRPLLRMGQLSVPALDTWPTVASERLSPTVLRGKQLFYDARDSRLARDRYMSCATCHNDAGHDGRTWDFTGFGEGLRNTPSLRGRAGTDQGWLHWSNNFDEVQDFETQIRNLSGGNGLMSNAALFAGTREQPLGDAKGRLSADLDALAAYLASLDRVDASPHRAADGSLPPEAAEGKAIFAAQGCGGCHAGPGYTASGANTLFDVGTLKPSSGQRLGQPLTGIDIPSLRDVWATAPYLHDGSAATLADAVRAHSGVSLGETDLGKLSAFLRAIGSQEPAPAVPAAGGRGLRSAYYNNTGFQAPVALSRVEAVNFVWPGSPGPGVNDNNFSVRWTGRVVAPITGSYRFQSVSNDSFVFTLGNQALIDNPTPHATTTTDTSAPIQLVAGQSYPVTIRFYDVAGGAAARLNWQVPTTPGFVPVPADRLFPN